MKKKTISNYNVLYHVVSCTRITKDSNSSIIISIILPPSPPQKYNRCLERSMRFQLQIWQSQWKETSILRFSVYPEID